MYVDSGSYYPLIINGIYQIKESNKITNVLINGITYQTDRFYFGKYGDLKIVLNPSPSKDVKSGTNVVVYYR